MLHTTVKYGQWWPKTDSESQFPVV